MDKTAQTEMHRLFLIDRLPEPLTPASSHLQIFDNYIDGTRLRLRYIRDPYSNAWTRILQQRFTPSDSERPFTKVAEIYLNDAEYKMLERLGGREIRKNRYFQEFDRVTFAFDVYLGDLSGLQMAKVEFETLEHLENYAPPHFAVFEITGNPFFAGETLLTKTYAEIQMEISNAAAAKR